MNASHQSCDRNYEISTPELNTLVSIMLESGALGARLTGAGFGGCAIALVRDKDIQRIVDNTVKLYYNTYMHKEHPEIIMNSTIDQEIIFSVKPSQGCGVKEL